MFAWKTGGLVWLIFERSILSLIFRCLSFFSVILVIFRCFKILPKLSIQSGKLKVDFKQRVLLQWGTLSDTGRLVPLSIPMCSGEARTQAAHLSQGKGYFGNGSLRILGFFQLEGGDESPEVSEFWFLLNSALSFKLWMLTYASDFPVHHSDRHLQKACWL